MAAAVKFLVFFAVACRLSFMLIFKSLPLMLKVFAGKAGNDAGQNLLITAKYGQGSLRSYQCPSQCNRRCLRTQYKKPCLFYCNKCCNTCLCVPPGYYGNKGACPCYNNWKTKRGGPKCP